MENILDLDLVLVGNILNYKKFYSHLSRFTVTAFLDFNMDLKVVRLEVVALNSGPCMWYVAYNARMDLYIHHAIYLHYVHARVHTAYA